MGQSLVKNYVHIVFSTKYRAPLITPDIEPQLHSYLAGICTRLECQPIKIGGYTDHIHILCMLSKNIALSRLLGELKAHSSKWIKTKGYTFGHFRWQNGYGAFSVNPYHLERVISYIANQHKRHGKESYQKEFLDLLEKHEIDYDERYLWR